MPPVRIFYTTPHPATAINAALSLYCSYEMYRVYRGTHPYLSPRLEAAGLMPNSTAQPANAQPANAQPANAQPANASEKKSTEGIMDKLEKGEVGWRNLNGVPIPTLEMMIRPFRRD